ncbi:hypothetical protein [Paenibacillus abyssi]|uniref:Uncharacterized protein n=1 Tax=Paenibacillus abyssi TaxID=1340531 RepID=A0A917CNV7_9BACL|nr:hypothetical protein [Paenibacillus abyssi]GGF91625.1 hypothetical protein GCM10010916_06160 [Paenibacillus abyssi]
MRKASLKLIVAVACIGAGILIGTNWSSEADSALKPGSIDDPVVTKSYVDQLFKQSGGSAGGGTGSTGGNTGSAGNSPVGNNAAGASLEVVTVPLGKLLIAKEEGTEFVVRSGKALVYSADKDGISNLTEGMDLTNGKAITNNHLLLSPRVGRGITPDPLVNNNRLIVLVRGSYELN